MLFWVYMVPTHWPGISEGHIHMVPFTPGDWGIARSVAEKVVGGRAGVRSAGGVEEGGGDRRSKKSSTRYFLEGLNVVLFRSGHSLPRKLGALEEPRSRLKVSEDGVLRERSCDQRWSSRQLAMGRRGVAGCWDVRYRVKKEGTNLRLIRKDKLGRKRLR